MTRLEEITSTFEPMPFIRFDSMFDDCVCGFSAGETPRLTYDGVLMIEALMAKGHSEDESESILEYIRSQLSDDSPIIEYNLEENDD